MVAERVTTAEPRIDLYRRDHFCLFIKEELRCQTANCPIYMSQLRAQVFQYPILAGDAFIDLCLPSPVDPLARHDTFHIACFIIIHVHGISNRGSCLLRYSMNNSRSLVRNSS